MTIIDYNLSENESVDVARVRLHAKLFPFTRYPERLLQIIETFLTRMDQDARIIFPELNAEQAWGELSQRAKNARNRLDMAEERISRKNVIDLGIARQRRQQGLSLMA